jgi:hypothetical protein
MYVLLQQSGLLDAPGYVERFEDALFHTVADHTALVQ